MAASGADPYEDMTDEAVLARATKALRRRAELPVGSVERNIQAAVFESAMGELDRRLYQHVLDGLGRREG